MKKLLIVFLFVFMVVYFSGCSSKEYVSPSGITLVLGKDGKAILTNNTKSEIRIKTDLIFIAKMTGWNIYGGVNSSNIRFENIDDLDHVYGGNYSYKFFIMPPGKSIELNGMDIFEPSKYECIYFYLYYDTDEKENILFYVVLKGKENMQFELDLLKSNQLEALRAK